MRKPRSCLRGDINGKLNETFSDLIALPLEYIFNLVRETSIWPKLWKEEQVIVIPKNSCPSSLGELRNLSCTPLYSKLLETFVLNEIKSQITLTPAQYGGQKGCGVDHFLVDSWDRVLNDLEDNRAATNLISIDFEKAFNRMDHNLCVRELARKGASEGVIGMVSAFLHRRTMSVRIGSERSTPKHAPGGSPQGAILGNLLFCVTADSLADCNDGNNNRANTPPQRRPLPAIGAEARTSTPLRPVENLSSSDEESADDSFRFFRRRRPFCLESSAEESYLMPQDQIDEVLGIPDRWRTRDLDIQCYIDDYSSSEKVRIADSIFHLTQGRRRTLVHAQGSQGLFENVKELAAQKKMIVNAKKTQMLCISASRDDVRTYISTQGKRILSSDTLKVLGFTFGRRPDCRAHLDVLLPKLRRKLWILHNLKFSGMPPDDILSVYLSTIRPVADFAAVAYHSLLTKEQSASIEKIQRRALKIIFGNQVAYHTALEFKNIPTLEQRRLTLVKNFALKTSACPRFGPKWFPQVGDRGRSTRQRARFQEFACRTERLRKSPLHFMRRLLNGA